VTVYYCYAVTNTGDITLGLHDLVDSELGTIFTGSSYSLTAGSSVDTVALGYSIPKVINATTTNTATWTAYNAGPVDTVEAQASATVTAAPVIPILGPVGLIGLIVLLALWALWSLGWKHRNRLPEPAS